MNTKRLYYHRTDGGAEYLCTKPIEGTNEGDLYTAVVRLDGDPELCGELATINAANKALLAALECLTYVTDGLVPEKSPILKDALKIAYAAIEESGK